MQRRGDLVGPVLRGHHGRRHIAQKGLQPLPLGLLEMIQAVGLAPALRQGLRPALDAEMVPVGKRPEPAHAGLAPQAPQVPALERQRRARREHLLALAQLLEISQQQAPLAQAGQERPQALLDRGAVDVVLGKVDQPDGMEGGVPAAGWDRAPGSRSGAGPGTLAGAGKVGLHNGFPAIAPGPLRRGPSHLVRSNSTTSGGGGRSPGRTRPPDRHQLTLSFVGAEPMPNRLPGQSVFPL